MKKILKHPASGNPILALKKEGPAKKNIAEADSGCVIVPEDIMGVKEAILSFSRLYRKEKLEIQSRQKVLRSFQRKKLAGDLVRILDELIEVEE